jgi:dTDP-4-amino-4,6-dideoxygalactose transaminase
MRNSILTIMQKFSPVVPREKLIFLLPNKLKMVLGIFPVSVGKEKKALKRVLNTGKWNMSSGKHLAHNDLEAEFCKFTGSKYAVAVGSGGVGIQMSLRALGLNRKSEVMVQVDSCSATAMAILNAQCIPRFVDSNVETFQFDKDSASKKINLNSGAVIASHLWGNVDDMANIKNIARLAAVPIIEDCCLALGSTLNGSHVGKEGVVGIYSFGSTKPIQAGEGGIIVTEDANLAKELRSMRHWGERTRDFGVRDVTQLSWNGRISEFSAAVALEQLQHFWELNKKIKENVSIFSEYLEKNLPDMDVQLGNLSSFESASFSQVILKIKPESSWKRFQILQQLSDDKIGNFYANFEPMTELSLFKSGDWEKWIDNVDWNLANEVAPSSYPGAYEIFEKTGIGLSRTNFQSKWKLKQLIQSFESISRNVSQS